MSWLYQNKIFKDSTGWVGFVYRIDNLKTGEFYIGKKLFTKAGYRQVKKKRRKLRKPSGWETYFGSNERLLKDVAKLGKDNFKREILRLCKTRSECSYYETKYILDLHCLLLPNCYNDWVQAKITRRHVGGLKVE